MTYSAPITVDIEYTRGTQVNCINIIHFTAVASMRRTEALASAKFYQILSIFIFFIRLIILEDFIRLISYNELCVRLGCSFFLAKALHLQQRTLVCVKGNVILASSTHEGVHFV